VEVQSAGVGFEGDEGSSGYPLLLEGGQNDDAHLCPQMHGREVAKVCQPHGRPSPLGILCFNDLSHLLILEYIILCSGEILPQGVAGIGDRGYPMTPESGIILDAVDKFQVFGLHGAQTDVTEGCHWAG